MTSIHPRDNEQAEAETDKRDRANDRIKLPNIKQKDLDGRQHEDAERETADATLLAGDPGNEHDQPINRPNNRDEKQRNRSPIAESAEPVKLRRHQP